MSSLFTLCLLSFYTEKTTRYTVFRLVSKQKQQKYFQSKPRSTLKCKTKLCKEENKEVKKQTKWWTPNTHKKCDSHLKLPEQKWGGCCWEKLEPTMLATHVVWFFLRYVWKRWPYFDLFLSGIIPSGKDKKQSGNMGRTIGIAIGCAAAYIVLVVGLMIYCKGRRAQHASKRDGKSSVQFS